MKILHVTPTYVPAWRYGGPIVSVHGLCKALARRGHAVSVYTTTVDGAADLEVPVGEPQQVDGVAVSYFRCDGPRRLYWSSGLRRALQSTVRAFQIVHAHACFLLPPTWAARAATATGVPYLFSPRGMLVPELIAARSGWIKRAWIAGFDARTLRQAAAVHVTSAREREDLLRVVPGITRFAVVANGVDWPQQVSDRSGRSGEMRVLCLGRINWKKGIDLAIRALASVPAARLRIVGNDEEGLRPELEKLAATLGIADRVAWSGPLYGDAKAAAYADADLLLMPSLSENFGNSALEAMAAGLPVLTTPEVGAAALVESAGAGMVVERSETALAAALARLAAEPPARERMGQAGRAAARAQSWDAQAARMEAFYQDALTGRTRHAA